MSRFQISLCVVFILVSTASASLTSSSFNTTRNWIDDRITFRINELATVYNNTRYTTDGIFTTILQKVRDFRLEKPKEIAADLEKRRSEFNQLIASVLNGDLRECLPFMDDLNKNAQEAIDTIRTCIDAQMEAVSGNITEVQMSIRKGLDELNDYRERALKCLTPDATGTDTSILSCLRAVKVELYLKHRPNFVSTILHLRSWAAGVESNLLSCSVKSLNVYYEHSSSLISTVNQCIESKRLTTLPEPSEPVTEPWRLSESIQLE